MQWIAKKKRRKRKPQLPSHVKPYYWILQMGLQLLCRTPWNLAALAGGMTWFLFALAVLTNHLGFITVYCDCCSRVLPSCASLMKLKTTIVGLFSCSYLLPGIWDGLIWILKHPIEKNPIKTITKAPNVGLKKTNYVKSQWKYFHWVF